MDFSVQPANANERLDVWLLAQVGEGSSRAEVQRWIKNGAVVLNGAPSCNPAKKVKVGEVFSLTIPAAPAYPVTPENIPLEIIYEDEALLVINKPVGLTVHPAPGNRSGTLVNALLHHCGAALSAENGTERPGIVHRLDKDTSGLLVVAKTAQAHRHLAKQFAAHGLDGRLSRTYQAIIRGVITPAADTITGNIGRHPTLRIPRAVVNIGGKHAVTHYKTLQTFGSIASLLELRLETGRTHQIRVHLAHKNHAVLADPLYGPRGPIAPNLELPPHQLLHAAELGFVHPKTQKKLHFTAPLPASLTHVIKQLNQMVK